MRTSEEILREALQKYADSANWLPSHIDRETGNFMHLVWIGPVDAADGWVVAERALAEADEARMPLTRSEKPQDEQND